MQPNASGQHGLMPLAALVGSMLSVNLGAAYAKSLFALLGSGGVTALRVGISALVLLAFWRPWRLALTRRDACNIALYGVVLGLMNLAIYAAFARIPIGIAIAIEVTGPLAVVLFSARHLRDVIWLACAALGLWLLTPHGAHALALDPLGVAYAAAAAFCWAMYIVFGKRVSTLHGGTVVAWGMLVAAICTVPVGIVEAGPALFTPGVLAAGLVIALLSSILPYSLEMLALARLPRRLFSILVSAGPAFGALAGYLLLDEILSPRQWLAIALIILATAGSAVSVPTNRT